MSSTTQLVLGIFVDLISAPFCYEGCAALMNKEWGKAISAYIVGIPLALIGLSIVGIIPVSSAWVTPIVEPLASDGRWWLVVLLFVLLWIGGPRFIERMRMAWNATAQQRKYDIRELAVPKKEIPSPVGEEAKQPKPIAAQEEKKTSKLSPEAQRTVERARRLTDEWLCVKRRDARLTLFHQAAQ